MDLGASLGSCCVHMIIFTLVYRWNDDSGIVYTDHEPLQEFQLTWRDFSEWNLQVNEKKTEFVCFCMASTKEKSVDTDRIAQLGHGPRHGDF